MSDLPNRELQARPPPVAISGHQHGHTYRENQISGNTNSHFGDVYDNSHNYDKANPEFRLPATVHDIPNLLSPYFTGRSDELKEIERALNKASDGRPCRYVIHGMPGLGKTQLGLKYAVQASEEGRYPYIFWLCAISAERLFQDFVRLADLLGLPGRYNQDQSAKLTSVKRWLEDPELNGNKNWLLVVDNVNDTAAKVQDILPQRNQKGNILMTTRTKDVAESLAFAYGKQHECLALGIPGIESATSLLLSRAGIDRTKLDREAYKEAEELVKSVGCLPLAVDQAGSFIKESDNGVHGALNIYQTKDVETVLEVENSLSRYEEASVTKVFVSAFEQLKQTSPEAVDLLRILAFLDPQNIPIDILRKGSRALLKPKMKQAKSSSKQQITAAEETGPRFSRRRGRHLITKAKTKPESPKQQWTEVMKEIPDETEALAKLLDNPVALQQAIKILQKSSLVTKQSNGEAQVLWIHDLVQLLLRTKLMTERERAEWLQRAICIICDSFDQLGDPRLPENWPNSEKFVAHIQTIDKHAKEIGVESIELLNASRGVGRYFRACGRYQEAADLEEQIVVRSQMLLGAEHPDTLVSMTNLGIAYNHLGLLDKAVKLQIQTLEMYQKKWGAEHPGTLMSINSLAITYSYQGRWSEAKKLQIKVLEMRQRISGAEHPDILTSINNLALTYHAQGWWSEAEKLQMKVLEMRQRISGAEHPDTLISMNNLAHIYKGQGRHDEAVELMRKVVRLRTKVIRAEHPDTLVSVEFLRRWLAEETT